VVESKDIKESEAFLAAVLEYREVRFEQALSSLNVEEIARYIREMYSKAFYGIEEVSHEKNKIKEKQRKKAELYALQSQIDPHFLYKYIPKILIFLSSRKKSTFFIYL